MKLIAVLTLLVAGSPAFGIAQQRPLVSVSISTPTPVVQTGAKIRVDVICTNKSDHTIRLLEGTNGQAQSSNRIEVHDEAGNKVPWIGKHRKWISRKMVHVEPGKSVNDFVILNDLYDLSKPGKYTVIFRHEMLQPEAPSPEDRRFFVSSNTLNITVTQ